jgi:hypothetical protein
MALLFSYTFKPVLRGHLWDKEKVTLEYRWPLKRGSIHMKFSMTGLVKGNLLIQCDCLTLEIYILVYDRQNNVAGLNLLVGSQPSPPTTGSPTAVHI